MIHIFKIRKIDIYASFQKLQGLHFLIAAAVINDWQSKSLQFGCSDSVYHLWHKMSWGYQIDIICFLLLKFQKDFCHPLYSDFLSGIPVGNMIVLAVDTPHGTACVKYGSRALFP